MVVEAFLVDEQADLSGIAEVHHGSEVGGALDAVVAFGLQPGGGGGKQNSAQAVSGNIHLTLTGGLVDSIQGGDGCFQQVVLEALVRETLIGIHPGHHEHRVALVHQPLHHGVARPQVHDVVLVHPRRHDQQRRAVHLLGARRVLNQLHEIVLENDLAGGNGEILSNFESFVIGGLDVQLTVAVGEIRHQILHAVDEIPAAGLGDRLHHFGVGEREVARRQRIGHLADGERELPLGALVELVEILDEIHPGTGCQQVSLFDDVECQILVPPGVPESPVVTFWLDDRVRLRAHETQRGVLREGGVIPPQGELGCGNPPGICPGGLGELDAGPGQAQGIVQIGFGNTVAGVHAPGKQLQPQLAQLTGDLHQLAGIQEFEAGNRALQHTLDTHKLVPFGNCAVHHNAD
jgi:hypothetical protein